mgnify:CR=1 FL=1
MEARRASVARQAGHQAAFDDFLQSHTAADEANSVPGFPGATCEAVLLISNRTLRFLDPLRDFRVKELGAHSFLVETRDAEAKTRVNAV